MKKTKCMACGNRFPVIDGPNCPKCRTKLNFKRKGTKEEA
jgi:DNA-directed RNA polymerase subunit RPC12/RpoP